MLTKKLGLISFIFTSFLSLIFSIFAQLGCSSTPVDYSCENLKPSVSMEAPPSNLNVGAFTFNIHYVICNEFVNGHIRLVVFTPSQTYNRKDYTIVEGAASSGSVGLSFNFTQPGEYVVWAAIAKPGDNSDNGYLSTASYHINVGGEQAKEFNIIELRQGEYDLWPNYVQGSINYNGELKRDQAFSSANTAIVILESKTNLEVKDFSLQGDLLDWTITNAGGDKNAPINYGLDYNVSIVCAIKDVGDDILPHSVNNSTPLGYTVHRMFNAYYDAQPAFVYVLMDRINTFSSDQYENTYTTVGVTIHELGHARGIDKDGIYINPPHSGNNASGCIMVTPSTNATYLNAIFCDGHINYIKNVNWEKDK